MKSFTTSWIRWGSPASSRREMNMKATYRMCFGGPKELSTWDGHGTYGLAANKGRDEELVVVLLGWRDHLFG
jgi:hypothetical protein